MVNLSLFQGINQFGKAYQFMLENDVSAEGSVSRLLMNSMIKLCPQTVQYLYSDYTPTSISYIQGSRPKLENLTSNLLGDEVNHESKLERIVRYTAKLSAFVEDEAVDDMRFGGLEEAVIERGSDWCTDIARVACTLCQIAGLPTRMVMLFDTMRAYSSHTVIEVYRNGAWGIVDSSTSLCYRDNNGYPLSAWDLMNHSDLIEFDQQKYPKTYCTELGLFHGVALSNYFFWELPTDVYIVTKINAYYRL